jgi:16S rRNA G966 N2-methylase RsmD
MFHPGTLLVVEHDRREPLPQKIKGWDLIRQRRIGDTVISFLKPLLDGSKPAQK